MDTEEIKKIIPHRDPFLFVDEVTDIRENYISGFKKVSADEPHFRGHFPNRPIMPGVLIIESLAQLAAIYIMRDPQWYGKTPLFLGIDRVRFRKPVLPGDLLKVEVKILHSRGGIFKLEGIASVNDNTVCEAVFLAGTM